MSNLGEQAMEILDRLHTERLAYESEYVPLTDAANLLTAYEQTGLDPEAIERMQDAYGRGLTLRTDSAERLQLIRGISTDRLRELVEADRSREFQRHLKRFDIMPPKKVVLDGLSTEAKKLYLDILTGDVLKGEQEG